MAKKYSFFIAISYTILLGIICLVSLDLSAIEDVAPSYSDKIFHFVTHFLLVVLWVMALINKYNISKTKAIIQATLISIGFGIIIEVLQITITSTRSFDFWDILSNTLGVFLAALVLFKINFKTR